MNRNGNKCCNVIVKPSNLKVEGKTAFFGYELAAKSILGIR